MKEMDHINAVMVDVSWLAARSFFAYGNRGMSVEIDGEEIDTGPLKGILDAVQNVRSTFNKAFIFLCVDHKGRNYVKRQEVPGYKAGRKRVVGMFDSIPDGLVASCVLDDVFVLSSEGHEADEVIVSFARFLKDAGKKAVAFAKDKDMFQALGDLEFCFSKFHKGQPVCSFNISTLQEKWGITPEACPMYQAITGDGVDGIKGIPRFQKKYAAEIAMVMPTPQVMKESKFMKGIDSLSGAAGKKVGVIEENFSLIERNYFLTNMNTLSRDDIVVDCLEGGMEVLQKYKMNGFLQFLETGLARRW